jgi:hypothetical protein
MTKSDPFDPVVAAHTDLVEYLKELKGVRPTTKPPFKAEEPAVRIKTPAPKKPPVDRSISPVTHYVRSLPGGPYFTAQEVADQVGCSVQAIRKYAKNEVTQAPSFEAPFGKLTIHLYTKEDVQALKDYINARKQVVPSKRNNN